VCPPLIRPAYVTLCMPPCSFLIAAGDPLQLPPVIAQPAQLTQPALPEPSGHFTEPAGNLGLNDSCRRKAPNGQASSSAIDSGSSKGSGNGALSDSRLTDGGALEAGPQCSLARPLFVRLAALGHPVVLLDTQYRCHPAIAAVPNAAFYGGRLRDGVSPEQRAPLMPALAGLPPVSWVELPGEAMAAGDPATRSAYNLVEVGRQECCRAQVGGAVSACGA
jgi:hypothetical protein